jgi:outer membrane biosynthesis protein TonB
VIRRADELSPIDAVTDLYDVIAPLEAEPARPRLVELALQRAGDGVASVKQHAAGAYYRSVDLTPLAGARPGAAAAAVAGCLALGGGTTYCVTQGMDPIGGLAHVVAPTREQEQPEKPRRKRPGQARVSATPVTTPVATPVATPTVEPPSPQPTAQATPQPTPEPTPPPAPEEEYEPVAPATAASAAPAPSGPARTPAPAPAGGPGEFDGP